MNTNFEWKENEANENICILFRSSTEMCRLLVSEIVILFTRITFLIIELIKHNAAIVGS